MNKKLISIVSPCFNEAENIVELYRRIIAQISKFDQYEFEILFIDNCSTDGTQELLRDLAANDFRVKVILNVRNFGHIRSPYWGIMQSRGDATVYMASDLQDPPEYISDFLTAWERGWKLVMMVKPVSQTNRLMHFARRLYYSLLDRVSEIEIIRDSTGFGLYDKVVLDEVRKISDPYPFLRGLVAELGYPAKRIEFNQPRRQRGVSKNNIYSLYDIAMLGLVSHSLVPIRLAGFVGLMIAVACIGISAIYMIMKILFWDDFPIGIAPLVIGVFFLFGLLFCFIGIMGEYIGSIHTYVKKRPIVVESERINF